MPKLFKKMGWRSTWAQSLEQPGPGERPEPIGRAAGNSKCSCSLGLGKTGKKTQLYKLGAFGILRFEAAQGLVEREKVVGWSIEGSSDCV